MTKVQQNTILRAFILFSTCGHFATQYLEHSADDRINWLTQLDTASAWIKAPWEKDVARRMVSLIEEQRQNIAAFCDPEIVYSVVYNSYFLMLFAWYEYSDLYEELCLVHAAPYSWHDLSFLRTVYFCSKRVQDADSIA